MWFNVFCKKIHILILWAYMQHQKRLMNTFQIHHHCSNHNFGCNILISFQASLGTLIPLGTPVVPLVYRIQPNSLCLTGKQ